MSISSNLPTEPIGSIPRSVELIAAMKAFDRKEISTSQMQAMFDQAVRETLADFEATGSPVISDGEQRKNHNFANYCVHGLPNFSPDGFRLQFVNHYRLWPRLTAGPFRYAQRADDYLKRTLP